MIVVGARGSGLGTRKARWSQRQPGRAQWLVASEDRRLREPRAPSPEPDARNRTMRHRVAHRKLGRVTEHRIAMLRNQAHALLKHERIETTVPRAKELRPFVERIISIAKRGVAGGAENGKSLHARRLVLRDIQDREVVSKLFDTIAPRFESRPGRLHPHPAARLPPRRQRRGRADRAGRQRVQSQRRSREGRSGAEGQAEGRRRPAARRGRAAARQEGRRGRGRRERRKRPPSRRARKREKTGRTDTRGKGAKTSTPRKAGGS